MLSILTRPARTIIRRWDRDDCSTATCPSTILGMKELLETMATMRSGASFWSVHATVLVAAWRDKT